MSYFAANAPTKGEVFAGAMSVVESMYGAGLVDYSVSDIDVLFQSDSKEKLTKLQARLNAEFLFEPPKIKRLGVIKKEFETALTIRKITMSEDHLLFLTMYLHDLARGFDCVFGDWGAQVADKKTISFDIQLDTVFEIGLAASNRGHQYVAFEAWKLCTDAIGDADASFNIGCLFQESAMPVRAVKYFDLCLKFNANYHPVYLNRGAAYFDIGEYGKSVVDYELAIKNDPEDPRAYRNAGNSYVELGELKKAAEFYDKAGALGDEEADEIKRRKLSQTE